MPGYGSWWIRSEKDPRWNCEGSAMLGGCIPKVALDMIKKMEELYGEKPDDLEFGCMKD